MITPIDFVVEDFMAYIGDARLVRAIQTEGLRGSELIDNLILLKFCGLAEIQKVLKEVYDRPFAWLNTDMTPPEYRAIADKHGVLIEKGRYLIVYIPLGQTVDESELAIDIPNHELGVRYIADCNYRQLKLGLDPSIISTQLAPLNPVLVFKRLIVDCLESAGTDLHLESRYNNEKRAEHVIRYRVKRELVYSKFKIDYEMMKSIIVNVIGKLTNKSAADVNSAGGVVAEVRDVFQDGSCDLRVSCNPVSAGYYMVVAIQTINTTGKTLDELGFPAEDVKVLREIANKRTGLTLITGKMRTGKNTTIFAMLNEICNQPIRIIEYSNPIENHMSFPQINYGGDIELLKQVLEKAKKQDIDIAVLNEIPNADVAFAVRDLVNSSIGVITTTHLDRLWHLPNKLRELYGNDYKTIISQLNAVVNHKMFRRWTYTHPERAMQKRILERGTDFEKFCYAHGVRQYFVPEDYKYVKYELQPLVEIFILNESIKSALLNFDEVWKGEQALRNQLELANGRLETKVATFINQGLMPLEEMRQLF